MTKPTDQAATIRMWRDTFTAMVEYGIDPGEAADAMLTVAGLIVAQHRGAEAARISLQAGADHLARREREPEPSPERSGGLHWREPINSEWPADVRFGAHFGLKSDIV